LACDVLRGRGGLPGNGGASFGLPMCKLATESTSRQPRAYMYSIIFMMSMPMMLTSGFGIAFYRLSRKAARMRQEQAEDFTADGDRG
jgi:hypothetical protein